MTKSIKDVAKVAFATLGSRVLGLVRDSATMAYMGIGAVSAAYTIAFTVPNLMRRLLGEGALTSALIPVFSQSLKRGDKKEAFAFLNRLLSRVFLWLLVLSVLGSVLSIGSGEIFASQERFVLGSYYAAILMPYMLLICLAAVFSGALNVLGSFGAPSIGPAILNVAIIAFLFVGVSIFGSDPEKIAYCMCGGWLVGGMFQLGIPAWKLWGMGWRFSPDFGKCDSLSELYSLFVPAMLGAAVVQINVFTSKAIAMFLNDAAVPALYISGRLLELPLGLFAVTLATVYFPKLSLLSSRRDSEGYAREYGRGLTMTMCVALPAAAGLAILSNDILSMLFMYGVFGAADVDLCVPVMVAGVAGLPFFALSIFATRGFHSGKNTKTPVKASIISLVLNVVLSLAFMGPFGAAGLAAANSVSGAVQAGFLIWAFRRSFDFGRIRTDILKIALATAAMSAITFALKFAVGELSGGFDGRISAVAVCSVAIPVSCAAYFAALKILDFSQFKDLKKVLFGRGGDR